MKTTLKNERFYTGCVCMCAGKRATIKRYVKLNDCNKKFFLITKKFNCLQENVMLMKDKITCIVLGI